MEYKATARYQRIAPRKVRLVVDLIRGLPVNDALNRLRLCRRRASRPVDKVVRAALAAAVERDDADADALVVQRAWVDEGPMRAWRRPRARGMWTRIRRRSSHIHVVLADRSEEAPGEG